METEKLKNKYQTMWQQGMAAIQTHSTDSDCLMGDVHDERRGITLLARLPLPITAVVADFLKKLEQLCPDHYVYPKSDMHLTIMSVVSCKQGVTYQAGECQKYLSVLTKALSDSPKFVVNFTGITLSKAGVLLTGYSDPTLLSALREKIRTSIGLSGLSHSMDTRYKIETAHSTIFRFKHNDYSSEPLMDFLTQHKHKSFGQMPVQSLELVFNDWYQSQANTQLIGSLDLVK